MSNIIDLTEGDSNEDTIELLSLSKAASNAQNAASRLTTNVVEAFASVSRSQPAIQSAHKQRGTSLTNKAHRVQTATNDYEQAPTSRPTRDVSMAGLNAMVNQAGLPNTLSERPKSPGSFRNARGLKSEPLNRSDSTNLPTARLPRAAAESAGRTISQQYDLLNPLEAQESKVTTPKKPGRPKLDQWTPKSRPSSGLERSHKREEPSQLDGGESDLSIREISGSSFPEKRKRSSPCPESQRPTKQAKNLILKLRQPSGALANLGTARPTSLNHERSPQDLNIRPTTTTFGTDISNENIQLTQSFSTILSQRDLESLLPSDHYDKKTLVEVITQVVYPALKKAKKRAKDLLTEVELASISTLVAKDAIHQKLTPILPQMLSGISSDQRRDIKRFVKVTFRHNVQQILDSTAQNSSPTNTVHLQSVPHSINVAPSAPQSQSAFAVLKAAKYTAMTDRPATLSISQSNQIPLSTAAELDISTEPQAASTGSSAKITNLSRYIQQLENETHEEDLDDLISTDAVGRRSSKTPNRERLVAGQNLQQKTGVKDDLPDISIVQESKFSAALSPDISGIPTSDGNLETLGEDSFPPGFDRGRFPAQRRRRANKFYNPERPSSMKIGHQSHDSAHVETLNGHASMRSQRSRNLARQSSTEDSQVPSTDMPNDLLIDRVATDPKVKALVEAVAASTATQSQSQEFQDLIEELQAESRSVRSNSKSRRTLSPMACEDDTEDNRLLNPMHKSDMENLDMSHGILEDKDLPENIQVHHSKAGSRWPGAHSSSARHRERGGNDKWIGSSGAHTAQNLHLSGLDMSAVNPHSETLASRLDGGLHLGLDAFPRQQSRYADLSVEDKFEIPFPTSRYRDVAKSIIHPKVFKRSPESRSLGMATNPLLERVVSSSMLNSSDLAELVEREERCLVTYADQEMLLSRGNIIKHVDTTNKDGERPQQGAASRKLTRLETKVIDSTRRTQRHFSSLLRHRELGSDNRGRNVETRGDISLRRSEMIDPWRYWKGASGDVVAVAWHYDSMTFAIGAAAHTNPEDLQYNRPCNLLLGDLASNSLTELPDHRVDRPKPDMVANTYNARQAVYDTCDPMVYETVSSIAFSPTANHMYTAGHDCTVKIWDTSSELHDCIFSLHHGAKVTSVEVSRHCPRLFATGTETIDRAIRVYYWSPSESSQPGCVELSSSKAQAKPSLHIYPECLRWGSTSATSHLLLAGFRQNESEDTTQDGQLCLWDANASAFERVAPSSQSVLAAAWHPVLPYFATGGSPGGSALTDRWSTKTVVRTWDLRSPKHYSMEYECSALDMQDITFHPVNSHIVTAGCTDGTSFVWDYRWPTSPLHRLKHGRPLVDWDRNRGSREEVDTGVMMSLWGTGGSLFYTGSSDGKIKAWDIRRHPKDALIRNVAQFEAGIQSGALSLDGTNLLVGDADGGVHVLSSAPCGPQPSDKGGEGHSPELPMTLIRAPSGSGLAVRSDDEDVGTEGQDAGTRYIESGQLQYDARFGVSKGLNYSGPYASDEARKEYSRDQAYSDSHRRNNVSEAAKEYFIKTRKAKIKEDYASAKRDETSNEPVNEIVSKSIDPPSSSFSIYNSTSSMFSNLMGSPFRTAPMAKNPNSTADKPPRLKSSPTRSTDLNSSAADERDVVENTISEGEMVEENYWWPDLGSEEITKAIAGLKVTSTS